ncbi:FadR/GntR family transcriptional regulator [Pseudonocardia kunmingensis]|uniref:GntR family transcriptional regulator n=1 Tax=Pseudonocardia kunmingensis TaxID=630975 RepID=A0A543DVH6_9PSEU|nr:FadR/GntR family transcriptional regulator [Pseudonocardia kunmingensis]TQM13330.1 GntR family transcriptional regulator [Pseudonocardia kunmingensis]
MTENRGPRSKLADTVAQQLTTLILSGSYRVGSKLPSGDLLASQFGVGRSSMREAVRTLQAAGYLRSTQGVGTFVVNDRPRPDPVDQALRDGYTMRDLFETRVAIEGKTAELAAQRYSDADRSALLAVLEAAEHPGVDHDEFVALDARFHRQIAAAAENPLLLHLWDLIQSQFREYSLRVVGMPGRRERAHSDHHGIAEAILDRDPTQAGDLARAHVVTVQRELHRLGG